MPLTEQILAQHLAHGTYVEHITPIKYKTKAKVVYEKIESLSTDGCVTFKTGCDFYIDDNEPECSILLCLRPLSQLTEPITENGRTFVPYDELKKVVSEEQWIAICDTISDDYDKICDMPYWWVNQLHAWHFNTHLSEGEYKEVNNDFNPYK